MKTIKERKGIERINNVLFLLREFKQAYKEENGVVTIGNIRDLVDEIELIEECVKKQKEVPTKIKKSIGMFGRWRLIRHCGLCDAVIEHGHYCPACGQKSGC